MLVTRWLGALEARHLANLRVPEVTRALRALSSAYVERRHAVSRGAALDSAGKRAAFALYYGPLHFLTTRHVVRTLCGRSPRRILDAGCGTGAAGAAWAVECGTPQVTGIDRHRWAVEEARWTYRQFGLNGAARLGTLGRLPPLRPGTGVIAAYVLNELGEPERRRLEDTLLAAGRDGAQVLVVEPIARRLVPWWEETAARVIDAGGRADEWRFRIDLPPLVALLDRAAGLDHQEITARTLWMALTR